ncbi:S-methyl-5-thioribose-1-phosphate isomerase [Sporomusa sp.]|uniref:S-methyl-5-thioribose-1-phosphate isomerase n=1 Tax=Sporomusa sp. TaxID=2078658 RepID=UPI002B9CA418|nr:S-methyl-5-thioribose-1-phosphate isomerase [Sporomusa sp.]HWR09522.1 S-methyl-5-thioribose-1-phosphate isomerase [Sporomusa sp.]
MMRSVVWSNNCLTLLNQTLLPTKLEYIECYDWRRAAEAIRRLEVRGAPAIGAAAAFALVLGARELTGLATNEFKHKLLATAEALRQTRPTAVNLFWAIDRMLNVITRLPESTDSATAIAALEQEAIVIAKEDQAVNEQMATYGASLFTTPTSVLTHCNAGALATVALGTALGVIRKAWSQGNITGVFADETRPLLQGARLTAWELMQDGIPVTLITDNMAGWVMKNQMVHAVIVGADRIALNGDVANKIGTYSVAILAKEHGIPFYVAAPVSTFDFTISSGSDIPIEERCASEVTSLGGNCVAPAGVKVFNPAFDVTSHTMISAIITEYGILRAPYQESISQLSKMRK